MTCDRTQHATTLTRPYVPFAGALVGRPPDGRWHARVVRDQQIGVAASVASLWRCVRRSGTMRDMRERVLVGVAVICLVIGAFIALAGLTTTTSGAMAQRLRRGRTSRCPRTTVDDSEMY